MTDNEFLLQNRKDLIKNTVEQYGEENFVLSFSGGKDSTVLSFIIDEALPNNNIPRLYANTGIEYNAMVQHVKNLQQQDNRIVIISPKVKIISSLEKDGYPFKSKEFADKIYSLQYRGDKAPYIEKWLQRDDVKYGCPDKLKYIFDSPESLTFKVSKNCCKNMKENPLHDWAKENNKTFEITGITKAESGERSHGQTLVFNGSKRKRLNAFNPMLPINKDFENWYIKEHNIQLCKLYYDPYNLNRTGCRGCPFNPNLQKDLDMMEKYLPNEKKAAEYIWKPVYDEYRKIGFRLRQEKSS